jgi:hypothetical protein
MASDLHIRRILLPLLLLLCAITSGTAPRQGRGRENPEFRVSNLSIYSEEPTLGCNVGFLGTGIN